MKVAYVNLPLLLPVLVWSDQMRAFIKRNSDFDVTNRLMSLTDDAGFELQPPAILYV